MQEKILAVNPGSTSTKLGFFEGEVEVLTEIIRYNSVQLGKFIDVWSQFDMRMDGVCQWVAKSGIRPSTVVGLGGLLRPVSGGTYRVNERMLADARANVQGEHVSNLSSELVAKVAARYDSQAFVVDPVSVDEFEPLARYSGHPLIRRKSLSHALNIHAAAHRAAVELRCTVRRSSFVVAHLGGGISVAPVHCGRIIDVNDAASGGPFSPERTGTLPLQDFISLCFSGRYSEQDVRSMVMGKGGLVAYLGTNSAREVEDRIASGDTLAREVYEAMAYQIAKEIGAMAAVLCGKVDAVILTGGLAASDMLVQRIINRVGFISPVLVYPGEDELRALALGALRVLRGEEPALEYPGD